MKMNPKKLLLATAAVVAVAFLGSACGNNKSNSGTSSAAVTDSVAGARLPIAYINVDSLMVRYQYSIDVQEQLLRKAEDSQATINQQGRALEQDMREFQRKVENNAFFDQSRAQREQERILKKQEDFQVLNQRLSAELAQQQMELQKALSDTIFSQVNQYNREIGHYQMILTNAGLLVVDDMYDITEEVVKYLNSKYTPSDKK